MRSVVPWKWVRRDAAPVTRGEDWFDRLWDTPFDSLFPAVRMPSFSGLPSVDVSETRKEVTVRAEIPGMDREHIQLTWNNGILRISGEKCDKTGKNEKGRYHRECRYGTFSRDVALGKSVDYANAKAKYKNGVLTVRIPKSEAAGKAIEVKVN